MFAHYMDVRQDEVVLHVQRPAMRKPRYRRRSAQSIRSSGLRSLSLQQKVAAGRSKSGRDVKTGIFGTVRSESQPCASAEKSHQAVRPVLWELVHGHEGQLYLGSTVPYGRQLQTLTTEEESGEVPDDARDGVLQGGDFMTDDYPMENLAHKLRLPKVEEGAVRSAPRSQYIFKLNTQGKTAINSISDKIRKNVLTEATLASILGKNNTESWRNEVYNMKVKWPMLIRTLYAHPHNADIGTTLEEINRMLSLFAYAKNTIMETEKFACFVDAVLNIVDLRVLVLALISLVSNANYTIIALYYIVQFFNTDVRCRTLTEVYPLLREVSRRFVVPLFMKLGAIVTTEMVLNYGASGQKHILLLVKFLYTMVGLGIISLAEAKLLEKADAYITPYEKGSLVRNLGANQASGEKVLDRGLQIVHRTYTGPIISGCVTDFLTNGGDNAAKKEDQGDKEINKTHGQDSSSGSKGGMSTYQELMARLQNRGLASIKVKAPEKPVHYIRRYTLSVSVKNNASRNLYLIMWRQPQNRALLDQELFTTLSAHVRQCRTRMINDAAISSHILMHTGNSRKRLLEQHEAIDSPLAVYASTIKLTSAVDVPGLRDDDDGGSTDMSSVPSLLRAPSSSSSPPPPPPPQTAQSTLGQAHARSEKRRTMQPLTTRLAQTVFAEQDTNSSPSVASSPDKQLLRENYALSSPTGSTNQLSSKADDLQLEQLRADSVPVHASSDSGVPYDPHVTHLKKQSTLRGIGNLVTDEDLEKIYRMDLVDTYSDLLKNTDVGSLRSVPHLLIRYNLLLGREKGAKRMPFKDLLNYGAGYRDKLQLSNMLKSRSLASSMQFDHSEAQCDVSSKTSFTQPNTDLVQLNEIISQYIVSISLGEIRHNIAQQSLSVNRSMVVQDCSAAVHNSHHGSVSCSITRYPLTHDFRVNLSRSLCNSPRVGIVANEDSQEHSAAESLISNVTSKISELHHKISDTESNVEFIKAATPMLRATSVRKNTGFQGTSRLRKQLSEKSWQKIPSLAELAVPPKVSSEYIPMHLERLPASGVTRVSFETWKHSEPVFYMLLACDADKPVLSDEITDPVAEPDPSFPGLPRATASDMLSLKDTIDLTSFTVMRWDKTHPIPLSQFSAPKAVRRRCLHKIKPLQPETNAGDTQEQDGGQSKQGALTPGEDEKDKFLASFELLERELLQYLQYIDRESGADINLTLDKMKKQADARANMFKDDTQSKQPFNLKAYLLKARAKRYAEMDRQKSQLELELEAIVGGCSATRRHLIRDDNGYMKPIPKEDDILVYYANRRPSHSGTAKSAFQETSDQGEEGTSRYDTDDGRDFRENDPDYVYEEREYSLDEKDDGEVRRHYRRYNTETGELMSYISESDHGDENIGQYYMGKNGKAYVAIRVRYHKSLAVSHQQASKLFASTASNARSNKDVVDLKRSRSISPRDSEGSIAPVHHELHGPDHSDASLTIFKFSERLYQEVIDKVVRNYRAPKRLADLASDIATNLLNRAASEKLSTDKFYVEGKRSCDSAPRSSLADDCAETLTYFGVSPAEARRISRGFTRDSPPSN